MCFTPIRLRNFSLSSDGENAGNQKFLIRQEYELVQPLEEQFVSTEKSEDEHSLLLSDSTSQCQC